MKVLTSLSILFVLMFYHIGASQNCPEFPIYNHVYIDSSYDLCKRDFNIHKDLTFHFPEFSKVGPATPPDLDNPIEVDWYLNADFGNGNVVVGADKEATHIYSSAGDKQVNLYWCSFDEDNGSSCYFYKKINFTILDATDDYESPDEILDITTTQTWNPPCVDAYEAGSEYLDNTVGKARAYIRYAEGHTALVKPIIFVDGLDFSSRKFVDENYGTGSEAVVRYGAQGWDVITMGARESKVHTSDGDYSEFQYYPTAFSDLQSEGYDIVFLDFERGADYIQKNGLLLIELLHQINSLKVADPETGTRHENIVIGASMGGQIARWALATMEAEGQTHCTQTYLSFDSPQKGASIALGLQATAWFYSKTGESLDLWEKLNRPAPRQLLVEHFGDAYSDGRILTEAWGHEAIHFPPDQSIDFGCLREAYVEEMEALAYPKETRNIAISCGSDIGNDLGYNENDKLLEASLYINDGLDMAWGNVFQFGLWASNGRINGMNVTRAKSGCGTETEIHNSENTIFGAAFPRQSINCSGVDLPHEYHAVKVTTNATFPAYDNAPGCFRYDIFDVRDQLFDALTAEGQGDVSVNIIDERNKLCFMPTMTALDIDWEMNTENMWRNIDDSNIVNTGLTPFDSYYAPNFNLKHVEIDADMAAWVSSQFASTAANLHSLLPIVPGGLNGTYNYGNPLRPRISNVTVQEGGYLRVNNIGATGYGDEPVTTNPLLEIRTSGCGSDITVEDGGHFILGNDNGSSSVARRANVYITEGSTVHIKSGGTLRLARGSQLIIEDGAILELDAGANIQLWWAESNIHIKEGGTLLVNGEFKFSGKGHFQFDKGNIVEVSPSADAFKLTGNYNDPPAFIKLNKDAKLHIDGKGLELIHGRVEYSIGSTIEVNNGHLRAHNVVFNAASGVTCLGISNPDWARVAYSTFNNAVEGVTVSGFNGSGNSDFNKVLIEESDFNDCTIGLNLRASTTASVNRCNFNGGSTPLEPQVSCAINGSGVDNINLSYSEIFDYAAGLSGGGAVILKNVSLLTMNGGTIDNSDMGIYVPCLGSEINKSNILLRKRATISNCLTGIRIDKGGVDMTGEDYGLVKMDCAKLLNNDVGIGGVDVLLDIDGCIGPDCATIRSNHFEYSGGGRKYFDLLYVDRADIEEIKATHNYWYPTPTSNGSNTFINYLLRKASSDGGCSASPLWIPDVELDYANAVATAPTSCLSGSPAPRPDDQDDRDFFTGSPYDCRVEMGEGAGMVAPKYYAASWYR